MPNKEALQPQLERLFSGFQALIALGERIFPDEVDSLYPTGGPNPLIRSFWFFYRDGVVLPLKQNSHFDTEPITLAQVGENMFVKTGVTGPDSFTIKLDDFLDNLLKLRRGFFASDHITLSRRVFGEEELNLKAYYRNGLLRDLLHLKPADPRGLTEYYRKLIQGNHAQYVAQTLEDNFIRVQPTHVGIYLTSIAKDKRDTEETVEIDNLPLVKREIPSR